MRSRRGSALRDRCMNLLSELNIASIPGRATMTDLQRRLEALRRRPVHLIPVAMWQGPTGVWVATTTADYIIHVNPQQTSHLHALHCVLHEVGHMLLGHAGPSNAKTVRDLFDSLPADPASPVRLRTDYDDVQEYEAEVFATIASGMIGRVSHATTSCVGVADRRLHVRLAEAFADGSASAGHN